MCPRPTLSSKEWSGVSFYKRAYTSTVTLAQNLLPSGPQKGQLCLPLGPLTWGSPLQAWEASFLDRSFLPGRLEAAEYEGRPLSHPPATWKP